MKGYLWCWVERSRMSCSDEDAESARMTKHRVKEQLVVHGPQCLARFLVQPSSTRSQLLLFLLPRPARQGRLCHGRRPVPRSRRRLHPQPQLSRLFCASEVSTRHFLSIAQAVLQTLVCRMSRPSRPNQPRCPRIVRVEWAESQ